MKGTIRALDLGTYEKVIEKFYRLILGLESIYEVTITMDIELYYPSLLNDEALHDKLIDTLESIFGKKNIIKANPI